MMSVVSRRLVTSVTLAGVLVIAGCGYNNDVSPVAPAALARVMVVQASPNTPKVDVWLDGSLIAGSVVFLNNTGYAVTAQSSPHVQMIPSGGAPLFDTTLPAQAGGHYTVFATDSLSRIAPLVLEDDLSPPAAGSARVRFVQLEPTTPSADFVVTGGAVLAAAVPFQGASAWMPIAAGVYNLEAHVAGTATVVAATSGVEFDAGHVYTFWMYGISKPNGPKAPGFIVTVHS
ncbi:MAG: DUF4397 domain-containing protein [Candidatus Eisenbacteria bacterium]